MQKMNNGRVDIKTPDTSSLFFMYDRIPVNECVTLRNPTEGLWDETTLSKCFFSRENMDILQNGIRAGIYKKSNEKYIISNQDCDQLKIIMRSVFLQYSANQTSNISQQIQSMNDIVLQYCIQQIYSELKGYLKYVDDISTLVVPIAHPVMANNTDRILEFKSWFG
jgi:hypothetical protein